MREKRKSKKLSGKEIIDKMLFSPYPASWFWGMLIFLVATLIIYHSDTMFGLVQIYVGTVLFYTGAFIVITVDSRSVYLFYGIIFVMFATLPLPFSVIFNVPTVTFIALASLIRSKKIKARWLDKMSR